MTREEIIRNLEYTMEKHKKNTVVNNTNIPLMCKDILDYLKQKPCPNAISRSDMLDAVGYGTTYTSEDLQRIIKGLLPVNPQPKMGRWIAYEVRLPDRTILNYRCSVCGRKLIGYNTETLSEVPFCHCGAKMQAESEG